MRPAKIQSLFASCRIGLVAAVAVASVGTAKAQIISLYHKHIVGYQGWFGCPSDPVQPGWRHWARTNASPTSGTLAIDLWPDVTELGPDELCDTGLKLPSGRSAYLFSSENPKTVLRHFRWMRENDIDGVALQRFLQNAMEPNTNERLLTVTRNVRIAAERTGVGFFIMYDISGANAAMAAEAIVRDWKQLVVGQKILESPAYLRHRGKPVIGIWGLGLNNRPESVEQAMAIIRFFRDRDVGYNRWIMPIEQAERLRHEGVQFALARAHRLLR